MPEKPVTKLTEYRHRGYRHSATGVVVQVFGNDPAPTAKDGTYQLLWDHDVVETSVVTPHNEK